MSKLIQNNKVNPNVHLDENELAFLLLAIKNSNFKGENVETLYNIVLKLQNTYTNLKK